MPKILLNNKHIFIAAATACATLLLTSAASAQVATSTSQIATSTRIESLSTSTTPIAASSTTEGTYPFNPYIAPPTGLQSMLPTLLASASDISDIAASSTATSTTVSFTTAQVSTAEIDFGTTTSYANSAFGDLALNHTITLVGLAPNTIYHYHIVVTTGNGSEVSGDQTFTTPSFSTAGPQTATQIMIIPTFTIATVSWATQEPTNSELVYGLTENYTASTTGNATLATTPTTTHVVSIQNLEPGETYHFAIVSTDASGTMATSSDQTFTTSSLMGE